MGPYRKPMEVKNLNVWARKPPLFTPPFHSDLSPTRENMDGIPRSHLAEGRNYPSSVIELTSSANIVILRWGRNGTKSPYGAILCLEVFLSAQAVLMRSSIWASFSKVDSRHLLSSKSQWECLLLALIIRQTPGPSHNTSFIHLRHLSQQVNYRNPLS